MQMELFYPSIPKKPNPSYELERNVWFVARVCFFFLDGVVLKIHLNFTECKTLYFSSYHYAQNMSQGNSNGRSNEHLENIFSMKRVRVIRTCTANELQPAHWEMQG